MGELECRAMFGGYGIYFADVFFGIIHKGRLFFKTNSVGRKKFESFGMKAFRPNDRQTLKTYFEVPVDIMEDDEELTIWAHTAVKSQTRKKKRKNNV
jgi:DNA transformation protein